MVFTIVNINYRLFLLVLIFSREMEDDNFNLTNLTTAHVPLNEEEEEKAEEAVY